MIPIDRILPEMIFTTSRSGGPGGQHVNKVESKVTLRWDVARSTRLTESEKATLMERLRARLTAEGVLLLSVQESRSQSENKEGALRKLHDLLVEALRKRKARKPTKATASSRKKRLESKKARSEKKKWRQKP